MEKQEKKKMCRNKECEKKTNTVNVKEEKTKEARGNEKIVREQCSPCRMAAGIERHEFLILWPVILF